MKLFFIFLFLTFNLFGTTRIMPLGDSITYDSYHSDDPDLGGTPRPVNQRHAYRNHLWYKLTDAGFNVDFVGSLNAGSAISPPFDPDNEGYPGAKSSYIASHVYELLQNNPADIVLLHIGSNDWSRNVSYVDDILDEVDRYEFNYHHPIKVILAKIINRTEYEPLRHEFNINLQHLANNRIADGDDIYVVDMEYGAGLHYDDRDFKERTHPNDSGYEKMARVWFNALKKFLTIPPKPNTLLATQINETSVVLKWEDNSENETLFKINNGATPLARPNSNSTQYTIEGLLPRTTYTFSLRACNGSGCSDPKYIIFTTKDNYAWLPAVHHVILY